MKQQKTLSTSKTKAFQSLLSKYTYCMELVLKAYNNPKLLYNGINLQTLKYSFSWDGGITWSHNGELPPPDQLDQEIQRWLKMIQNK